MLDPTHITGLILSGGRGSRMEGRDKGLQLIHGQPLICHVLQRLTPQVSNVLVSANRHLDTYQSLGLSVLQDILPDYAGPLAGLQAGLQACRTPYLVCVPCDAPKLPLDLVARLGQALEDNAADLAVAATPAEQGEIQHHPVFCLLRHALISSLNTYLEQGGRAFWRWQQMLPSTAVIFPDANAFVNINTMTALWQLDDAQ